MPRPLFSLFLTPEETSEGERERTPWEGEGGLKVFSFRQERVTSFDDDHSEQSNLLNIQFITWSTSVESLKLPELTFSFYYPKPHERVKEGERHLSRMEIKTLSTSN